MRAQDVEIEWDYDGSLMALLEPSDDSNDRRVKALAYWEKSGDGARTIRRVFVADPAVAASVAAELPQQDDPDLERKLKALHRQGRIEFVQDLELGGNDFWVVRDRRTEAYTPKYYLLLPGAVPKPASDAIKLSVDGLSGVAFYGLACHNKPDFMPLNFGELSGIFQEPSTVRITEWPAEMTGLKIDHPDVLAHVGDLRGLVSFEMISGDWDSEV